jgi:membrane protein
MGFAANAWALVKDTVTGFIADNALSRGASIAYYTLFSIAPVLRSAATRPKAAS